MSPPFRLAPDDALEPRATLPDGVVLGAAPGGPPHDAGLPPLLSVAWLDDEPETTLADVEAEELPRALAAPGSVLLDREPVALAGEPALRTFMLHRAPDGRPTASEQWRLLAGGRRWTISALTALADQPDWGPRLAAVAATLQLP